MTQTIREAYNDALAACVKLSTPASQRHMVACLAVKDAMADTLDNLKALRDVMQDQGLRAVAATCD